MTQAVEFLLNGESVAVARPGTFPLLFALRGDLGLPAARFGCGQERCGACMVQVDGRPRPSCTLPLAEVAGASVLTPEGLVRDAIGSALLEAFREEGAGQCGYCLNGILISAHALLRAQPAPGRAALLDALAPHLCRCGAHGGILRAVERAAARLGTP